jgi:hypothetical protein
MVSALIADMEEMINENKGGDDRIDKVRELRLSNGDLLDARNGGKAILTRDFVGGGAHYQLEFELSKG